MLDCMGNKTKMLALDIIKGFAELSNVSVLVWQKNCSVSREASLRFKGITFAVYMLWPKMSSVIKVKLREVRSDQKQQKQQENSNQ